MPPHKSDDEKELQKQAIKEAIREWLDEQYAAVGRWTVHGLIAAAFAGAVYLMLQGQGWHR